MSWSQGHSLIQVRDQLRSLAHAFHFVEETEQQFTQRVKKGRFSRVRLISAPSKDLETASIDSACFLDYAPVLANGRFELIHFLREVSFSIDYHRYGNLGVREGEHRKPLT